MTDLSTQALALWGLENAPCSFVAGRENRVYRVEAPSGTYALRIKRPGYRTVTELQAELQWLAAMGAAGLSVPRPLPALSGRLLEQAGGHDIDMVSWLSGVPLGRSREPLALADAPATFAALGREMARLHTACDAWDRPPGFTRCTWDAEGLLGADPLWGRFWENPTLDAETRDMLLRFRAVAQDDLSGATDLDQGLIHADLVRENVLLDGPTLHMIDFDDGGFGFRLFDVATALLKNRAEPDFPTLQSALIAGYRTERPLDTTRLPLFLALRAVTYLGWIVPRMSEPGAPARNTRFIADAQALCAAYLDQAKVH